MNAAEHAERARRERLSTPSGPSDGSPQVPAGSSAHGFSCRHPAGHVTRDLAGRRRHSSSMTVPAAARPSRSRARAGSRRGVTPRDLRASSTRGLVRPGAPRRLRGGAGPDTVRTRAPAMRPGACPPMPWSPTAPRPGCTASRCCAVAATCEAPPLDVARQHGTSTLRAPRWRAGAAFTLLERDLHERARASVRDDPGSAPRSTSGGRCGGSTPWRRSTRRLRLGCSSRACSERGREVPGAPRSAPAARAGPAGRRARRVAR